MGALSFLASRRVMNPASTAVAVAKKTLSAVPAAPAENALPVKREAAAVLSDSDRAVRDERWQFCRAVVDMASTGRSHASCCTIIAARDAERYPILSAKGKLNYGNARNWLRRLGSARGRDGRRSYNWDNINALADNYVTGSQPVRFDRRTFQIFCAAYLNPRKPPFTVAYRETKNLFLREFPEIVFPSQAQIRYLLSKLPANLIDAGRYGIDYAVNRSLYMLIRDWSTIMPGQCWFADSRTFDQWIRIPDGKEGWRAIRPNVTFILDARSWFCVGFDTSEASVNSDMIRNTFARACVEHGRPEFFYVDNGRDYNKAGFTVPVEINGRELCIIQALGVKLVNSKPYQGRSKTVERRFREFSIDFDKRQPSYCGSSPETRPDGVELYTKGDNIMLLPTLGQFNQMLEAEIDQFHRQVHGGHLQGRTPLEIFNGPDRLRRAPMTESELYRALLLPDPRTRKVHRGGCVDVGRIRYYAPELFELTGEEIVVKSSYLEPGRVHAYTLGDRYIAECTAQAHTHPLAHHLGTDDEQRMLAEQLVIQGRQRRSLIDGLKSASAGLYGLAIAEITTLNRTQIESGIKPVVVGEMSKVKGDTHQVKLLTTPDQAGEAKRLAAEDRAARSDEVSKHRAPRADRREFDANFTSLMAGDAPARVGGSIDPAAPLMPPSQPPQREELKEFSL